MDTVNTSKTVKSTTTNISKNGQSENNAARHFEIGVESILVCINHILENTACHVSNVKRNIFVEEVDCYNTLWLASFCEYLDILKNVYQSYI